MCQRLKIKVNDRLRDLVVSHIQTDKRTDIPVNILEVLKSGKNETPETFLSVADLRWLHNNVVSSLDDVYLHEIIDDADLVLPEPEVLPRNPELEARIQRLKVQQMERDYKSMTKNVDSVRYNHPEDSISYQMKQMNRQLIAVIQFIFSVGAGFTFGFIGVELIVGELDFGFRLLLGVICALVIALAEIYFLAKKLADDLVPPTTPLPGEKGKTHQD